jgi:hypothetical protein
MGSYERDLCASYASNEHALGRRMGDYVQFVITLLPYDPTTLVSPYYPSPITHHPR